MAIAPTGAIYKALSFDNESSRSYGIYITGDAVYNAPERDVEMISIPGRNGTFAMDRGRFENIEVTYPAGVFASTETDFAQAISDFRNFLCSRKGYVRLSDGYNPNEYRMAVYKSGLEVSPAQLRAGEFDITFDCMPQRYLTSGETAVSVSDGQTLVNPTLFESSPMLEFDGYGSIGINGETVTVSNGNLGEIQISSAVTDAIARLDVSNLNTGDAIINRASGSPRVRLFIEANWGEVQFYNITNVSGGTALIRRASATTFEVRVMPNVTSFVNGTNSTITTSLNMSIISDGPTISSVPFEVTVSYDAVARSITLTPQFVNGQPSGTTCSYTYEHPAYYGISTKNLLPSTMYVDLDIGEAYGEVDGVVTSFNSITTMPAKLPTLKPGSNTISFSNTMSNVKITPRWWKI